MYTPLQQIAQSVSNLERNFSILTNSLLSNHLQKLIAENDRLKVIRYISSKPQIVNFYLFFAALK